MKNGSRYPLTVMQPVTGVWKHHRADWQNCAKCNIGLLAHTHVFARGTLPCDILFIGEGPGRSEDALGKPFVGKAGELLQKWIDNARANRFNASTRDQRITALFEPEFHSSVSSFTFAITNTVLCRPTDSVGGSNRPPTDEEVNNCSPRFEHFVRQIAKPKAVVLLGRIAAKVWTMAEWTRMAKLPMIKLLHPAAILYGGGEGSERDMGERQKLSNFVKEILG
jgi:uracil-DNA glycosylase